MSSENLCSSRLDIAPFARVMSWNPKQTMLDPHRAREFPAEEVFPGEQLRRDDGVWRVHGRPDDGCSIGLEWESRRFLREVGLRFAGSPSVGVRRATLEYWAPIETWGNHDPQPYVSCWQGNGKT